MSDRIPKVGSQFHWKQEDSKVTEGSRNYCFFDEIFLFSVVSEIRNFSVISLVVRPVSKEIFIILRDGKIHKLF